MFHGVHMHLNTKRICIIFPALSRAELTIQHDTAFHVTAVHISKELLSLKNSIVRDKQLQD
ncbi:hypothetical protein DERF_001547 [Dermatophagoides farinae]|uniref:Uncharacterized protein n=1 Tax=Dermatophagoides farinae TaxID=6954 RepID=A0A922IF69_DERFA|nr:hypothetical protein DERF_001547 [Dermatophagoides farinae]